MEYYNLDRIIDINDYRLIIIVGDNNEKLIPNKVIPFVSEVYSVAEVYNISSLCSELCYESLELIIEKEIRYIDNHDEVHIVCINEANMLVAAKLRDKFKLRGASYESLIPFRNKYIMKEILSKKGVRVPRYLKINDALDIDANSTYQNVIKRTGAPFIVKPISAVACKGVYKIENFQDFRDFLEREKQSLLNYEAEEYISGKFYHCDILKIADIIKFAECSEYAWPALMFNDGKVFGSIGIHADNPVRKKILEFAINSLKVLGMPDGSSHMELFITEHNEIVFIEVAARVPGLLTIEMYEKMFGVNMLDEELSLHTNINLNRLLVNRVDCFWGILPLVNGVVNKLIPPKFKSVSTIKWYINEGDKIKNSTSNLEQSGSVLVWNENFEDLYDDFQMFRNHQPVVVL